jgi:DNA mismatch repair protein MutS
MYADRSSLIDLGLLPDDTGTWPLAPWLDHTHARSGHEALRRLLATPPADLEALGARQALFPQLAVVARLVPWSQLHGTAAYVEQFLRSNYILVPSAPIARMIFAARFGEIVTYVESRVQAVEALFALCEPIYERIAALPGDPAFTEIVDAFGACLRDPRREYVRSTVARGQKLAVAGLDTMVRGGLATDRVSAQDTLVAEPMRNAIQALLSAIGNLDAFCSLATASANMEGVLPLVEPRGKGGLSIAGLRHPLLATGVPNDVELADSERVLFLTGPNMAGKSTLLRAVGIAVYCAHLGMKIAASAARIPWHDDLLVSITVRDNLQRGESLYLAEVRRVRAIVETVELGREVLAIFDEVFRGTNIKDATQATTLLVDGLARAAHGTFVIASHLADVAEARCDADGVACWCMEVDMRDDALRFTYRARPGVSDVHLGMVLLDAEGVGPVLRRMAAQPPPRSLVHPSTDTQHHT